MTDYFDHWREGYVLTPEAEAERYEWHSMGGCRCWQGAAPCCVCEHPGHPASQENNDECWIKEEDEDVSRDNIVDKSKNQTPAEKVGLKVGSKIKLISTCHHRFKDGDIICLYTDDGTISPYFTKEGEVRMSALNLLDSKWEHYTEPKVTEDKVEFKVGDKVKRTTFSYNECIKGETYTISDLSEDTLWFKEIGGGYMPESFELVKNQSVVDKPKEVVYATGVKVRIVADTSGHSYKNGEIVTLKGERGYNSRNGTFHWQTVEKGTFVVESDIELVYQSSGNPCSEVYGTEGSIWLYPNSMSPEFISAHDDWKFRKFIRSEDREEELLTFNQNKGDTNMSQTQRRVVKVTLIDDDKGLDVAHSVVWEKAGVVTEDDDATTFNALCIDEDIGSAIALHNEVRSKQINQEILNRTGQSVELAPIKIKNLRYTITPN